MGKSYQKQWTGVFGDPVDDNPTVVMEQAAFDAAGIPMEYLTIQVKRRRSGSGGTGHEGNELYGNQYYYAS